MKRTRNPPPPVGAEPVYSVAGHRLALMMHYGAAVIGVMAALGAVSALLQGGWPFALVSVAFIAFVIGVWKWYDTERVFASGAGLARLRDGEWRLAPWPRVGEVKPFLGVDGSVVLVLVKVDGEPRPTRFIAKRSHRTAIERWRAPSTPSSQ